MVFSVVMYGCKSWIINKPDHWRIDAFGLWCWRRLFRALWKTRRSNQSILKEISPEYSLDRLMLKLKPQYFGHLIRRTDSSEKTLKLGKIECGKRRGQQRMRGLGGITDSMDMNLSKLWKSVIDREAQCAAAHGVPKSRTWLSDWTKLNWTMGRPHSNSGTFIFPLLEDSRIYINSFKSSCIGDLDKIFKFFIKSLYISTEPWIFSLLIRYWTNTSLFFSQIISTLTVMSFQMAPVFHLKYNHYLYVCIYLCVCVC